jgi:hypothetical protein
MKDFFNSRKPYDIADKITNEGELSADLVAHIYILMQSRDDIENPAAFFARCAYQQYNWKNSEFNRLYNPYFTSEFNDDISIEDDDIIHNDKYRDFLNDYFEQSDGSPVDWYKKELVRMWLSGDTYRTISKNTTINIRYITEAIKQFKNDVYNSFYSSSDGTDTDNF